MKITTLGVIAAMKSIGGWLASYTVAGIKSDPYQFMLSFLIFALITVPGDLFLLNRVSNKADKVNSDGD